MTEGKTARVKLAVHVLSIAAPVTAYHEKIDKGVVGFKEGGNAANGEEGDCACVCVSVF